MDTIQRLVDLVRKLSLDVRLTSKCTVGFGS
jgi:hypothetical protein